MKQWGFEKNTSASDMKFILMKGEKRKRDEGKETMFYIRNRVIDKIKLERFKKRKFVRKTSDVSALAGVYIGRGLMTMLILYMGVSNTSSRPILYTTTTRNSIAYNITRF